MTDTARKIPCGVNGKVRVKAQHLHAERKRGVCDLSSDSAESYNAERFSGKFNAAESGFSLFDLRGDISGER